MTGPIPPEPRTSRGSRPLRVGLVCPYSLDVPGGVQAHVVDLGCALRALGHTVDVLAPADDDTPVPDFVTPTGRAFRVPYNGSVARIAFGPVSYARVRRWLSEHTFDVLHIHEPTTASISAFALMAADGPIVVTFHTSTERSRTLAALGSMFRPAMEKITARIAVSPLARRVQVEHLGGDAVEIPNGVDVGLFSHGGPLPGYPRGSTVGFVGRFDEPRKGMPVLLEALRLLAPEHPDLRLLVVGRGDAAALRRSAGRTLADRLEVFGPVDDATKATALRSIEVFCAPQLGGESFGMVLTEAMAAGAPVLASDLDAFRAVIGAEPGTTDGLAAGRSGADDGSAPDHGPAGVLFRTGDAGALARALAGLLADPARRAALAAVGRERVARFDWPVVAASVIQVYHAAMAADPRRLAVSGGGAKL